MTIRGIFYARFLPQEGTKIVAQSPPGCIVPVAVADESDDDFDDRHRETGAASATAATATATAAAGERKESGDSLVSPTSTRALVGDDRDNSDSDSGDDEEDDATITAAAAAAAASALLGSSSGHTRNTQYTQPGTSGLPKRGRGKPLVDFEVMQEYVIPRPAFFNHYLAAQDPSGRYIVLGLPVAIRDAKYDRNEFIFNFGIVVDAGDDQGPYERVVRRLASTFAEMEKQNQFLSREELREQQRSRSMLGPRTVAGTGSRIGGISESWLSRGTRPGSGLPTNTYPASPAAGIGSHASGTGSEAGSGTPGFHAMAGALGNTKAISNIDEFLDRRRIAAQSPQTRPNQHGGAGSGSIWTASTSKVSGARAGTSTNNIAASATAASNTAMAMNEHNGHSPYHRRSIQSLLEIIKEDLNLYGECMIPVDDANTINMKLFPLHPNPPAVEGWHVPVPKMRLADTVDPSWDLTLQRVIAHMDGVSDVRRIAFEADISMELCRSALRHLLYYDTILLLDMFFFGSCYAPRPGIHDFVANVGGIVDECARYVCLDRQNHQNYYQHDEDVDDDDDNDDNDDDDDLTIGGHGGGSRINIHRQRPYSGLSSDLGHGLDHSRRRWHGLDSGDNSDSDDRHGNDHRPLRVSNYDLVRLMTSFCVGRTVTEWLKSHADAGFDVLRYVDVRRLVQFGVIKGCLYRVHKYVVSKQYLASLVTGRSAPDPIPRHGYRPNYSRGHDEQQPPLHHGTAKDPLQRYTDGHHHFDQIITEQNVTEVELIERLKRLPLPAGDLKILYR
ncbi:nitrogen permease regulator [Sporothrix schenckii 1099-18]|uniref:Nitrogen permease regulator 2 n=2 Tax=Sporothrix schenckii TaxID=29908 RepID=U7PQQ4_SPOS1|nr:nitrogen permease regulator [Sporothrix schenckii 1099-18]ERS96830.1 hypothetical protein HMPREF1624_07039 [Sporothrix schenckii ATCC 58251]KJR81564.1 nitrogen permease regulator [Sporothrix schenckii 1099-18]